MAVYARGKYLDNYEWTDYINKYGWGGAREAAIRDGWSGVRDDKFESAVAVWDPKDIKSATANRGTFDESSNILHQPGVEDDANRGYLEFPAKRNGDRRTFDMTLLKAENKSTAMHEFAHFYLEVLGDLAEAPNATPEITQHYGDALKALGITSRAEITPEIHEKFADSYLTYLREGKAPTPELQSAFRRFSKWMTQIGSKLISAKVEMSDELRSVFDRMVATDQEIENAKNSASPMFATAKEMGVSEPTFQSYVRNAQETLARAKEVMMSHLMAVEARRQTEARREDLKKITEETSAEVKARPEYQVLTALSTGEKFNTDALVERYGKDVVKELPGFGKVHSKDGVADPDALAVLHGFESGDKLIEALRKLPGEGKAIHDEAKAKFDAKYPDPVSEDNPQLTIPQDGRSWSVTVRASL
jgi:hypothetical protein